MYNTPGIKKYKFISKILANITILIIGPSMQSVKINATILSKIPKSFEKLLLSRPLGVISKYEAGLLTKPYIIRSCNF